MSYVYLAPVCGPTSIQLFEEAYAPPSVLDSQLPDCQQIIFVKTLRYFDSASEACRQSGPNGQNIFIATSFIPYLRAIFPLQWQTLRIYCPPKALKIRAPLTGVKSLALFSSPPSKGRRVRQIVSLILFTQNSTKLF